MPKPPARTCACCGAKIVEYKHGLNTILVRALQIAWRESTAGEHQFKVSDNEAFTYSERSNFQKLKYWGFVRRALGTHGEPREGWWHLTDTGRAFLRGETTAPKWVRTYRGEISTTMPSTPPAPPIGILQVDPAWQIPRRADFAKAARPATDPRQAQLF